MEMEMQLINSSYPKSHLRSGKTSRLWARNQQHGISAIRLRANINYCGYATHRFHWKNMPPIRSNWNFFRTRAAKSTEQSTDVSIDGSESEKKGTIVGAVALIIGTSIGVGILALPMKTSPAGIVPSAVSMILCWGFLLIEALLLAEINVGMLKKKGKRKREEEELEIISIRTMAQETLGEWGGNLATVNYIFLGYATMVAHTSKFSEILYHLINLPTSISGFFFIAFFTTLISVGGIRTTDQVNQWLTASMLGLLVAIEVLAVFSGGFSGFEASGNWGRVPETIPAIIFALVYLDITPVICAYLGGDLGRIRASLVLGSLVPLLAMLVWVAIALGLSTSSEQAVDPLDLLMRVRWSGVSTMVEAFSLLVLVTSSIGTLLAFSQFFIEQLNKVSWTPPSTQIQNFEGNRETSVLRDESSLFDLRKWWGSNKLRFTATAMSVAPPLLVSTTVPDAFSAAIDIAGGYCVATLYGILPPAMAWVMHTRSSNNARDDDDEEEEEDDDEEDEGKMALSRGKPALIGVGLFACGIVVEKIIQDLLALHP